MTPHKHAKVIKAWADGAEIEFRFSDAEYWSIAKGTPLWAEQVLYRIKPTPVMAWYRVAELMDYTVTADSSDNEESLSKSGQFIRWLSDRIEYEVTP